MEDETGLIGRDLRISRLSGSSASMHRYFAIGGYLQATPYSFERKSGSNVIGTGDGVFASAGFSGEARFTLSDDLLFRGGLTVGRNVVTFSGKTTSNDSCEALCGGWNVGLVGDLAWRVSRRVGISTQLGFLSQISGSELPVRSRVRATSDTRRDHPSARP
jgi:hypothetical protein